MRFNLIGATAAVALLASGSAYAEQGTLTIWSWNVAASALKSTVEGFNKKFDRYVKVTELNQLEDGMIIRLKFGSKPTKEDEDSE